MGFLRFIGWLATNLVAIAAACVIFDGIGFEGSSGWDEVADNFWALVFVALVMGIVNSFVAPIIKLLSLPFIIVTLGLFLLLINALMLFFTEWLVGLFDIDFYVTGFWNAVGGAIVITIVTWIVGLLFGDAQEALRLAQVVTLPPARRPGSYRVAVVCLGNICRSPMAEVVLSARVADAGLDDRVTVSSSGTGGWHVGDPMDRRAAATLTEAGYDATRHRAQQWSGNDDADLVLAMDAQNLADVGGASERVLAFRTFDPDDHSGHGSSDVPDPYYGGDSGFEEVLAMVERTAQSLVAALKCQRPWGGHTP